MPFIKDNTWNESLEKTELFDAQTIISQLDTLCGQFTIKDQIISVDLEGIISYQLVPETEIWKIFKVGKPQKRLNIRRKTNMKELIGDVNSLASQDTSSVEFGLLDTSFKGKVVYNFRTHSATWSLRVEKQ